MIVERAPAKINLALHVRRRRADGYHEIETLFAFLQEGDEVRVAPADADRLTITGPFAAGLAGHDNLVTRAATAFASAFAIDAAHAITLDKRLPIASGIGGGSADAAATLRALARLHELPPDHPKLFVCAEALGSDVPACLLGRAARGSGRGELLVPVDGVAAVPVLLVNPGIGVSTSAVFAAWDGVDRGAIAADDPIAAAIAGRNDLASPARAIAPVIDEVLVALERSAPRLARMSGSGATCFALYRDEHERHDAARRIAAERPEWWCLESLLA